MQDRIKVTFIFKKNYGQFLLTKQPEIIIFADGKEKLFVMENNRLDLELPRSFTLTFQVPYMGSHAFKVKESVNLKEKNQYEIIFKPKFIVYSPAKIIIK